MGRRAVFKEEGKRRTYFAEDTFEVALSMYAAYRKLDKSSVIKEACREVIPEQFFKMAEETNKTEVNENGNKEE